MTTTRKMKERAKRLDRDTYDPPSRELIGAKEVADALGMRVHSVLQAIRHEHLWAINMGETRAVYYTTWRAVVDWVTSGHYTGPHNRKENTS